MAAALARETRRIRLHAGSVVLPLHDPVRIAEEWAVADNLSGGRVGIGCASGWHASDFALHPDRFTDRTEIAFRHLEDVRRLWRARASRAVPAKGTPSTYACIRDPCRSCRRCVWRRPGGVPRTRRRPAATSGSSPTS
ncbi:LLM class flavin-dependent oxidoreductase [Streptomyces mirabilis]|nr:LLM class flavin-dependent oxidoreductase [Streptomyces mirabilis]